MMAAIVITTMNWKKSKHDTNTISKQIPTSIIKLCMYILSKTLKHLIYRVAQNKPDYLLLLSKFCISIPKHVSMITHV